MYPRSWNRRMAPRTRAVPEDKCEDDPEAMFPLRTAVRLLSIQRSPECSGLQWQFVCVINGRAEGHRVATCCGSPRVVDRCGTETNGRSAKFLFVVVLNASWCFTVAHDDCCRWRHIPVLHICGSIHEFCHGDCWMFGPFRAACLRTSN